MSEEFVIVSSFEDEESLGGDASGFYLEHNGRAVVIYGDYYYDKGLDKCDAFIDGYCFSKKIDRLKCKVEYVERADYYEIYK